MPGGINPQLSGDQSMSRRSLILTALAGGVLLTVLTGCDQLSRKRFDMITVNVDQQYDVKKLIGPPDDKLDDQWVYERPEKHVHVLIDFDDSGRVVRKQWVDGLAEEWMDTRPDNPDVIHESTTIHKSKP
jgi:hypothetical protein